MDGLITGGAILFADGLRLNIGRIFVDSEYFRKGYGIFMMQEILGYTQYKKDDEFIYCIKRKTTEN